jgi:tetratricopeptide (TPR) repeat protein
VPAHKLTRKDLKHDSFVEWTARVYDFLQDHYLKLAAGVLAIAVLAVGMSFYGRSQDRNLGQASFLLYQGQSLLYRGAYGEASSRLEECVDRYGGTIFAKYARIDLGQAFMGMGENERALEVFTAAENMDRDDPMYPKLMTQKAAVLSNLERFAEAEAVYRSLLAMNPTPGQRQEWTYRLADCLQAEGRIADAVSLLAGLQDEVLRGELTLPSRDLESRLQYMRALSLQQQP